METTLSHKIYLVQRYHNYYVAPLLIQLLETSNAILPLNNLDYYIKLLTSIVSNLSKDDLTTNRHSVLQLKNSLTFFHNTILSISPQNRYRKYGLMVKEIRDALNVFIQNV